MTTSFPTSLQDLDATRGQSGNPLSSPNHITHHTTEDDTIEALQAKVGIDGSDVTTSHDYKLSGVTGSDKALKSGTSTQSVTNLTLVTPTISSPALTVGSDATGDTYYRGAGGFTRLAKGTDGQIMKLASGIPSWATETVTNDASTTVKGIVEIATSAEVTSGTGTGGTGAILAISPDGLAASTPVFNGSGLTNLPIVSQYQSLPIVTGSSANFSAFSNSASENDGSVIYFVCGNSNSGNANLYRFQKDSITGLYFQTHDSGNTNIASSGLGTVSIVMIGTYVYVISVDAGVAKNIWRFDKADFANKTAITISGTSFGSASASFSDGTDLYIYDNSSSVFRKYTISGTTATNSTTVTYTSAGVAQGAVCNGTNVWIIDAVNPMVIRKYAVAGGASTGSTTRYMPNPFSNPGTTNIAIVSSTTLGIFQPHTNTNATVNVGTSIEVSPIAMP